MAPMPWVSGLVLVGWELRFRTMLNNGGSGWLVV